MATFIDNIFDKIGNIILPKTVTKAVWGQTSGNRLDQELDGIEAALAQPNTGVNADSAYSAGKYIYHVKNKELYKAKSNIASGAAFNKASGGNVDVVNIGDQLQTISSDLASTNTTVNTLSLKAGNNAGTGYQTYGVGDSLADTVTSTVIPWIKRDGSTESGVFGWMWLQHGYYITIYAYLWEGSNKILMLLTKSSSGQTFEDSRTVAA